MKQDSFVEKEYEGKEWGTPFEQIVFWATHSGWRYCQGGERCGNEVILKMSHFKSALKRILESESNTQSNLQSKGASKEQLYFNTLTEGQRIKYFEDVERSKLADFTILKWLNDAIDFNKESIISEDEDDIQVKLLEQVRDKFLELKKPTN